MNPIQLSGTPPLREALYALAMSGSLVDAQAFDVIVRQYPEYAEELTDFAVELFLDSIEKAVSEVTEATVDHQEVSPVVSRAISTFHNHLYTLRQADQATHDELALPSTPTDNPFSELSRSQFRELAGRIGVNTVFVAKLRDRQIEPNTIPESFTQLVAEEMKIPVAQLSAHFAATGRTMASNRQFYKSGDKPKNDQRQSFAAAVKSSGLSEDAQQHLLGF